MRAMKALRAVITLFIFLVPAGAFAHLFHGEESHKVTLSASGDRLGVDYLIEVLTESAPHDPDQAKTHETVQDRAVHIMGLQRVVVDRKTLQLFFRGVEERGKLARFRYDTGPGSLSAGEHDVDYLALYSRDARGFSLALESLDGGEFIGSPPPSPKGIRWTGRVRVTGHSLPGEAAPGEGHEGLWAKMVHAIRTSHGPVFWVSALGLSFLFGMLHALRPGHGKTLAAAYLVNRKGGAKDAALFAGSATLTHTLSAFVLALVAYLAGETFNQAWIRLGAAIVMVLIGVVLLVNALRGRHVHLFGGHSHGHGHDHSHSHDHDHPNDH